MKRGSAQAIRGTTSLVALITITTLSFLGGSFIIRITNRSREGYQSASWIEASQVAESGAAVALAEIRRVLPLTNTLPTDAWTGWTATDATGPVSLPNGRSIPAGMTLKLPSVTLSHAGEGNTTTTATVTVDAPASLVDSAGLQWYRVRATGTALLPGRPRVSFSSVDRKMRRLAFVRDWSSGLAVARPQVSRSVEWIVQPAPHFGGALQAPGLITSDSSLTVNSFDSTDPLKSTSGLYDSHKQQKNANIYTNNATFSLAGTIMGNVSTGGATVPAGTTVTGKVDTASYQNFAAVSAPGWSGALALATRLRGKSPSLSTSITSVPALYHLTALAVPLTLKSNLSPLGAVLPSKVTIWVDGDITNTITVEAGVQATIFFAGNVNLKGSNLNNQTQQAANLQLYGIEPAAAQTRTITLNLDSAACASIYAPGHDLTTSGNADLIGSFICRTMHFKNNPLIHYDESLARRAATVVDYQLASWIEDVR